MPKSKATNSKRIEDDQLSFFKLPSSAATNGIIESLGAGENVADLQGRVRQFSNSRRVSVSEDGERRLIELSSAKSQVIIELTNINKLIGKNKAAKKLFIFALIKANMQALSSGELTRDYISFPLSELIDKGLYTTVQSARVGFKKGMDALTSIKLKGELRQSEKKKAIIEALEIIFTGYQIKNSQCTVYLNHRINWQFLAQYFTILPIYYFLLSNRAGELLNYIFYLARQKSREIRDRGYFRISFRSIQSRLQLPSEKGNRNPDRTIRQEIEKAVEEIESQHSDVYGEGLLLELRYDEGAPIKDYLDNGYLKVMLSGIFADSFIEIRQKRDKIAEPAK